MQADAEHQEDDADLGQFGREALVGDEARREGADGDAGEQIAYERRYAEALGQRAKANASARPATIVVMRDVECGITSDWALRWLRSGTPAHSELDRSYVNEAEG